MPQTKTNKIA